MWGYLTQFWNAVTQVTVGGVDYTIAWFQAIGNAVAGALGNLFEGIFRHLNDFFIFIGWTAELVGDIFNAILTPLNFLFAFFKSFFLSFSADPISPPFSFPSSEYFAIIPLFTEITTVLAMAFILYVTFAVFKRLT